MRFDRDPHTTVAMSRTRSPACPAPGLLDRRDALKQFHRDTAHLVRSSNLLDFGPVLGRDRVPGLHHADMGIRKIETGGQDSGAKRVDDVGVRL